MQEVSVEDAVRVDSGEGGEVVVGARAQRMERKFARVPDGGRVRVVRVGQTAENARTPQQREQVRLVLRAARRSHDACQRVAHFCETQLNVQFIEHFS